MKRANLAGILFVVMVVLLSGCAGQKGLTRHYSGPPPEEYGKYSPVEVERSAKNTLANLRVKESGSKPCPPDDPIFNHGRQANYIHLGRMPVDPNRGYDPRREFLTNLPQDHFLRVEQKGGKWIKGTLPKGTVLVTDLEGKVLRICTCANGVTLLGGKPLMVKPKVSLSVETLPLREVTSKEAILQGRVVSEDQAIAWFTYWEDGERGKFATRPQYATNFVESKITNLKANTRYYYQLVAINTTNKKEGDVYWFLSGRACLGSGTVASTTGGAFMTFGLVNIANPVGWGSLALGTGLSAYGIIDKDSDPTCKAVGGLLGGTVGAVGGVSYYNSHQSSGSVSSEGPGPNPPTGPGPNPPNGPAPAPGN